MSCRIVACADGVHFYSTYNDEYVADLKLSIPGPGRKWNPTLGCWVIKPLYLADAIRIARKHFGANVTQTTGGAPPPSPLVVPSDCWAVLWLRPNAPLEVVNAAYKALALIHHPDVSGSRSEMMQKINAAVVTCRAAAKKASR